MHSHRFTRILLPLLFTLNASWLGAGDITQVRVFNTWADSIIKSTDPAGITYHAPSGHLFITDSEINEIAEYAPDSVNVFEVSLLGDTVFATYDTRSISGSYRPSHEPTGITYNSLDGYFYITNDNRKVFYRSDTTFGTSILDVPTVQDAEGIAFDPNTGNLYVADGNGGGMKIVVYN
ncbi:MAG: hypothetical protein O7D34_08275, partial [Ignavibacteria bacterium]|nr:hypothetical protein [Ignavibacteria bacterium]